MKILWLCPEVPYPLTTGLLRVYSLLRELGQRHEIAFVCLTRRKTVAAESIEALAPYTTSITVHSEWDHPEPWLVRVAARIPFLGWRIQDSWRKRSAIRDMNNTARQLIAKEKFDVIVLGGQYTAPAAKGLNLPMVFDCCDTNSARFLGETRYARWWRRPVIFARYLLTRRLELKAAQLSRHITFISARDRRAMLGPSATCEILPQGVDYDYWHRTKSVSDSKCIVFTGAMDYSPNDDGAQFLIKQVLPLVRQAVPSVKTMIVGRDPLPDLVKAAKPYSDITITGMVPDIRPYLERATVYVAPLRFASGVQNKVLEAMAMELPVVTTPVVADGLVWDGARAPVVVAKRACDVAEQIVGLLNDTRRRARLGQQGREFVVEHCSWKRSTEILEGMCVAAAKSGESTPQALVHAERQCA
jgi:glycosyltransferase involved in cell wall biosynthesis